MYAYLKLKLFVGAGHALVPDNLLKDAFVSELVVDHFLVPQGMVHVGLVHVGLVPQLVVDVGLVNHVLTAC
jgi:hypothetical protein